MWGFGIEVWDQSDLDDLGRQGFGIVGLNGISCGHKELKYYVRHLYDSTPKRRYPGSLVITENSIHDRLRRQAKKRVI